ncbi:unnamed protein product [Vicia faba]|uniref:Interferon-related developmental regulator C-terminal domain-containing protein n=1 Tax=Vicia faba TaxID=3906 RepID=A0AAV0Z4T8_VICFA|nr:unnamed protein product [Vicia faba]
MSSRLESASHKLVITKEILGFLNLGWVAGLLPFHPDLLGLVQHFLLLFLDYFCQIYVGSYSYLLHDVKNDPNELPLIDTTKCRDLSYGDTMNVPNNFIQSTGRRSLVLRIREEKKALKEEKLKQEEKYTWAIVDGVKEKDNEFLHDVFGFTPKKKLNNGEHRMSGGEKRMFKSPNSVLNKARTQLLNKQRVLSEGRNFGHYSVSMGDDET